MKRHLLSFLTLVLSFVALTSLSFDTIHNATTIILVRHAEKASTGGQDPELTDDGRARAEKLTTVFPGIKPDVFYSTNFKRTKNTLQPWAKFAGREIQLYEANEASDFAKKLLQEQGKTIVIAGHSNTIPPLVNLLVGEEKYKNLEDSEYDKIFVVTVEHGKVSERVMVY